MSRADGAAARAVARELTEGHPQQHEFEARLDKEDGVPGYTLWRRRQPRNAWHFCGWVEDLKRKEKGIFMYGEKLR